MTNNLLIAVPLLVVLMVAVVADCRWQRIPNGLSLGGAAAGLAVQATLGNDGLILGALGWIACLAVFLPFYARGAMAAGDVKLMAAVGAFLGPLHGLQAVLFTLVAGSMIAVVLLTWQWLAWVLQPEPLPNSGGRTTTITFEDSHDFDSAVHQELRSATSFTRKIPYASAIALGTLVVVLEPYLPISY